LQLLASIFCCGGSYRTVSEVFWEKWEMHTEFWLENLKGKDHSADRGVDGKGVREKWRKGVERIHLAQDRDHWRAVVNTVMNLLLPYKVGNFLTI
jgi:hypothetical protein